jgi:hypothetical protein
MLPRLRKVEQIYRVYGSAIGSGTHSKIEKRHRFAWILKGKNYGTNSWRFCFAFQGDIRLFIKDFVSCGIWGWNQFAENSGIFDKDPIYCYGAGKALKMSGRKCS